MNWTGGSLQRSKIANKGVIQKQRAFFAKARTSLQHAPISAATPFCPDYLPSNDVFERREGELGQSPYAAHSTQPRVVSKQRCGKRSHEGYKTARPILGVKKKTFKG